jgi:hypothetical protein
MKQHSDDYKLSAVMYYINHNEDLRDTCDIFKCKYQLMKTTISTIFHLLNLFLMNLTLK